MTWYALFFLGIFTTFTACSEQPPTAAALQPAQQRPLISGDTVAALGKEIRCIYQDAQQNYWFATNGEGVFKYDGKNIVQFTEKHGLCSNFVWNVLQGQDGRLWFKTRDAICYFNGTAFITLTA